MNNDEVYEFEDRVYVNPTQSRDEQLQFVENLRDVQTRNNQQIADDTYNLGTQVPSSLGGLTTGAANPNSYWASRYQTPQVQSQVANLVATAQADALNKILSQDQSQYANRAQQAYRAYQKRNRNSGNGTGGTTPLGNTPANQEDPDINTTATDDRTSLGVDDIDKNGAGDDVIGVTAGSGGANVIISSEVDGDGYMVTNKDTGEVIHYNSDGTIKSSRAGSNLGSAVGNFFTNWGNAVNSSLGRVSQRLNRITGR